MSEQAILRSIISLERRKHQELHQLDHVRAKHVWTCGSCKRGTQAKNLTVIGVHYPHTNHDEPLAECHRLGTYAVLCPKCNQFTMITAREQSIPGQHQFIIRHKPYFKRYLDFYQSSTDRLEPVRAGMDGWSDKLFAFLTKSDRRDDRYHSEKRPMPEHQFFAEQQQFEHQKRKPHWPASKNTKESANGYIKR